MKILISEKVAEVYLSNCSAIPYQRKSIYNFAASMQWIPVLSVEDEIINCFSNGGGVPYPSYKRFHEFMAEESYQTVVVALVDHILPLVPSLTDAIHDQPDHYYVLRSIYNSLDYKGFFLCKTYCINSIKRQHWTPLGPFLYTISCLHCVSVSLSQNGAGLGAIWGKEKATEMLNDVGFTNIAVKKLPHDFQNYYYIAYKSNRDGYFDILMALVIRSSIGFVILRNECL
jgi:hypothetical protein